MKNIILIGMPGCGKTTIGKELSKKLGLSFVDSDQYIEETQKVTISQIFTDFGEEHFRLIEMDALKELSKKSGMVLSTGGGVVERCENIDILKNSGIVVFINRPLDILLKTIDASKRPLLKDGKDKLKELYSRRIDLYRAACHIEVLNDSELEHIVENIIKEVLKIEENTGY